MQGPPTHISTGDDHNWWELAVHRLNTLLAKLLLYHIEYNVCLQTKLLIGAFPRVIFVGDFLLRTVSA